MNPPCNACGGVLDGPHLSEQAYDQAGTVWWKCQACDQSITLAPSGRWTQIILPALYPEKMDAKMHHEFAEHEGAQKAFVAQLMYSAGWLTKQELAVRVSEIAAAVRAYKDEHPLPTSLLGRLRGKLT